MKKEQFDRVQEEIEKEEEEEKLVAIAAEKEQAYEKNLENSSRGSLKKILHIHHHIINGQ